MNWRAGINLSWCVLTICACGHDPDPGDLSQIPFVSPEPYSLVFPKGLPTIAEDNSNPLTKQGVLLGRHLFYDPLLSLDSTISCSSCHNPNKAFTDGKAFSTGVGGH